jgi:Mg2+ and Co2+ transporter CorA
MKKIRCDICWQPTEKESIVEGVERLLQDFINEDINDVCLECFSKIIESVYDTVNYIKYGDKNLSKELFQEKNSESISESSKTLSSNKKQKEKRYDELKLPLKKKRERRKYTREETHKFKETLCDLASLGSKNKEEILDILEKEFPDRLRKSNAIRISEMLSKPERITKGTKYEGNNIKFELTADSSIYATHEGHAIYKD